jgi:hypothetical protein
LTPRSVLKDYLPFIILDKTAFPASFGILNRPYIFATKSRSNTSELAQGIRSVGTCEIDIKSQVGGSLK